MSELSYLEKLLDGVEVEWLPLGNVAEIYGGLTGKSKSDFENGNARYVSYKKSFINYFFCKFGFFICCLWI